MLKIKSNLHIEGNELWNLVHIKNGKDYEGEFNEIYCPPCCGSVPFSIPDKDEFEQEYQEIEDCEKVVIDILMENGFTYGDTIYIDVDY